MKKIIYSAILCALSVGMTSCSDFLDKKSSAFDSDGFYESEAGLTQGLAAVYRQTMYNENWGVPQVFVQDVYSPYALQFTDNNTIGAGPGLTPDQTYVASYWSGHFHAVGYANNVIAGAKTDFDGLINGGADISGTYRRRLAETYVMRAYNYYNLLQAFGDLPFFTEPADPNNYKVKATPKEDIADYMINQLTSIIDADILPFYPEQVGRVGNGMALNLLARYALLAGSCNFRENGKHYFEVAADAAKKVMDQGGLANDFADLFTMEGQKKSDARKEILWVYNYAYGSTNYLCNLRLGHTCRTAGGSSVRFPSMLLVMCFEDKDGKRIDESTIFDPTKPYLNRDSRMAHTVIMHGQEFWYNDHKNAVRLNCYDKNCDQYPNPRRPGQWYKYTNQDHANASPVFGQPGFGALWMKYNEEQSESPSIAGSMDLIVMRVAEAYLTYAEAMIESGHPGDQSVIDAINAVRLRAGQPKLEDVDPTRPGNLDKMRQIVRRERKVELAMEGLLVTDFRRWDIGDILNSQPTYGQPVESIRYEGLTKADMPTFTKTERHDLNDVPDYSAVADKYTMRDSKRYWKPCFKWWPIPRGELDKNPNLVLAEGY